MDIKASADVSGGDKSLHCKLQQEQMNENPLIFDLDERIGPESSPDWHRL